MQFSFEGNSSIIKASINYIKNSKRFDKSLFWTKTDYYYYFFFFCTIGFCVVQVLRFPCCIHNILFSSPFNLIQLWVVWESQLDIHFFYVIWIFIPLFSLCHFQMWLRSCFCVVALFLYILLVSFLMLSCM